MGTESTQIASERQSEPRGHEVNESQAGVASTALTSELHANRVITSSPLEPPDSAARCLSVQALAAPILRRVQRSYGNRSAQRMVMRADVVQRYCECGGKCAECQAKNMADKESPWTVQRKSSGESSPALDAIPSGSGHALDSQTRVPLESYFRSDLSDVRVHTDSAASDSARRMDAMAYTVGRDIYFASSMYSPSSSDGQRLLAHEVTHVVQQSSGMVPTIAAKSSEHILIGAPDDPLEAEADRAAEEFLLGGLSEQDEELSKRSSTAPIARRRIQKNANKRMLRLPEQGEQSSDQRANVAAVLRRKSPPGKGTDIGDGIEPQIIEDVFAGKIYDTTTKDGALSYAQDWHTQLLREYQPYMTTPYGKAPADLGISFEKQLRTGRTFFIYTAYYWPKLRQKAESSPALDVIRAVNDAVNYARKDAETEEVSATRISPADYRTLFPESFAKEYEAEAKKTREEELKQFDEDEKWKIEAAGRKDKTTFLLFAAGQYRPRFLAEFLDQEAARIRKGLWDQLLLRDRKIFFRIEAQTKAEAVGESEYEKYVERKADPNALWKDALVTKGQWQADLDKQNKSDLDISAAEKDLVSLSITAGALRTKFGREVLPATVIDAWDKADDAMVRLRPAAAKGEVPDSAKGKAVELVSAFYEAFRGAVVSYDEEEQVCGEWGCDDPQVKNRYYSPDALSRAIYLIRGAKDKGSWKTAFTAYNDAVTAMDGYIADQLEKKGKKDEGEQLKVTGGRARVLADLLEEHKGAQKVQAIFYPLDQLENVGQPGVPDFAAKGIPLLFYIYREGSEWSLSDITTAQHAKVTSGSGGSTTEPDMDIFAKVNSKLRFPKGRIYFTLPDGTYWLQETTEPWRLSQWLTWIGLGIAAIGLAIVTFGGSIPASVIILGAAVGVAAATSDFIEKKRAGVLTAKDVAVDGLQIVASILSAGSARLGQVVLSEAASAGIAASEVGGMAGRLFIPVTIAAVGADLTSFAVLTDDSLAALAEIDNQPGSDEDRKLAKLRILASLIAMGAISFMAIKSNVAAIRAIGAGVHVDVGPNGESVARPLLKDAELLNAAKGVKNSDAITKVLADESLPLDLRTRFRAALSEALTTGPIATKKLDDLLLRLRTGAKLDEVSAVLGEFNARSRIGAICGGEVAARVSTEDALLLASLDQSTFAGLKGASPRDLRAISSVLAMDAKEGARLVRQYGPDLIEYLRTNPLPAISELEDIVVKQRAQVTERIKGVYEGVETSKPPEGGWKFDDGKGVINDADGVTRVIRTSVRGPNGAVGYFERAYNPITKKLELRMAFLRLGGQTKSLPSIVPQQAGAPEMIAGRGTPTVQYVSLYQMKLLGVPVGEVSAGVSTIHMSGIQNVETVLHLHWLRKQFPTSSIDELIEFTASMKYAETTAVQTGYRRSGRPTVTGGDEMPIRDLLKHQEQGNAGRIAQNKALLEKYGFGRDTKMRWNFDIDFSVIQEIR